MTEMQTDRVICGDNKEVLLALPLNYIDTVITDPPYELGFMGKKWDNSGIAYDVGLWQLVLARVKPGAMLFCFGGTRTYHRLACAIEDAGWQIRDCMMWIYGSGFPKSHDISKAIEKVKGVKSIGKKPAYGSIASRELIDKRGWNNINNALIMPKTQTELGKLWDGWGTALKPAYEPIIIAMKPLDGTFAHNAEKWGVAGLNIDGGRIGTNAGWAYPNGRGGKGCFGKESLSQNLSEPKKASQGRWPANVVFDEEAGRFLDKQSGIKKGGKTYDYTGEKHYKVDGFLPNNKPNSPSNRGDSGGASRFFYCAKASKSERGEDNNHPTVKPLKLMNYLCEITKTPTGGIVLDPFCGSGTTLVAAKQLGRKYIGIDISQEYCNIAEQRLKEVK